MKLQPEGLVWVDNHWTCQDCKPNHYYSSEDNKCLTCPSTISNCDQCADDDDCETCKEGYLLVDGQCHVPHIKNCKEIDETDLTKCAECHDFFALNSERNKCINCEWLSPGCVECTTIGDEPLHCTECMENLEVSDD